ncbi:hypothetical protein MUK42_24843 [Musa troglodytarum]|uniref:Uncharacterized protein n=1 Tax=Musa troglodytarum TaxID=320322 RepID=A0A9E7KZB8_9LILI|nr:hypothetical protein MUK42_24843 [Musa troglodytarum]
MPINMTLMVVHTHSAASNPSRPSTIGQQVTAGSPMCTGEPRISRQAPNLTASTGHFFAGAGGGGQPEVPVPGGFPPPMTGGTVIGGTVMGGLTMMGGTVMGGLTMMGGTVMGGLTMMGGTVTGGLTMMGGTVMGGLTMMGGTVTGPFGVLGVEGGQ